MWNIFIHCFFQASPYQCNSEENKITMASHKSELCDEASNRTAQLLAANLPSQGGGYGEQPQRQPRGRVLSAIYTQVTHSLQKLPTIFFHRNITIFSIKLVDDFSSICYLQLHFIITWRPCIFLTRRRFSFFILSRHLNKRMTEILKYLKLLSHLWH